MPSERAYEIIDAYWAWEARLTGKDIGVAILDTGIDVRNHSARDHLLDQKGGGRDFTGEEDFLDLDGHGTMMAGIVAASEMTGCPLRGIAPEAKWFNARVIERSQEARAVPVLEEALRWSLECKARVALMALNLPAEDKKHVDEPTSLEGTIRDLSDLLVVLSSGDLRDTLPPRYLSDLPNVIVVGAVDNDERYISLGDRDVVPLAAPGQAVLTVGPKSRARVTGSSAAAAFVAGAAALYFEKFGGAPEDAKKDILNSCRRVKNLSGKVQTSGILNLPSLLDLT